MVIVYRPNGKKNFLKKVWTLKFFPHPTENWVWGMKIKMILGMKISLANVSNVRLENEYEQL